MPLLTPFRAMLLSCLLMGGLVLSKWSPQTGFTALLGFGSKWDGRRTVMLGDTPLAVKHGSGGYDAQFYSQVALDPTLMHPDYDDAGRFIDWPSYRARRIGMPVFAHVIGAGRPAAILNVFALINVVCWAVLARVVWLALSPRDWFGFARWFFCCFSIGAVESVRLAQTDLPATLLALVPALYPERCGRWGRGVMLGVSVFVKETALLGFAALPWRRASLGALIVAGALYAVWLCHVYQRLGLCAGDTSNFGPPFAGLRDYFAQGIGAMRTGFGDGRHWFGVPAVAGLVAQSVWLVWRRDWRSPVWRLAVSYALLIPFVSLAVWGGHWNAGRVLLPVTLGFNLLYSGRGRSGWLVLLAVNSAVLHALIRFL